MTTLLDLVARMHHADLYVFVLMLAAHHTGADLVTAQWLRTHCTYPQGAIADSLFKLATWGLAEQPIRYQWRLTAAAKQLPLPAGFLPTVTPRSAESGPMYGGVVESIDSYVSTTTTPTNKPTTPLSAESSSNFLTSAETAHALRLLLRLGAWPNRARDIAAVLADDDYINLRDVLGWIVYCRDPRNQIHNAAAVVCANLQARERVSSIYRAAYLCGACRRREELCTCANPDLHLPDEFDDLAFSDCPTGAWGASDWLASLWFCPTCGGRPCQCPQETL